MRQKAVVIAAAVVAAIGLVAPRAQAQGFSVYEHDACAMGRSGAGVAAPCTGGSAIFFNPAGIVTGTGAWNLTFGATLIPPRGGFTADGGATTDMTKDNNVVPHLYLTRQVGTRMAVGVGMFVPYGLTTEWPNTFAGRFLAYKTTLHAIYVQPTVAFKVTPRLQVGAGIDFIRTSVELHQRQDLYSTAIAPALLGVGVPLTAGTDFADARIHGTANSTGAHFGIIWRATDKLSLGARYMTGVTAKGKGFAGFTQVATGLTLTPHQDTLLSGLLGRTVPVGATVDMLMASQFTTGALQTQAVTAAIALPAQFVAGFAYQLTPSLQVMADAELTQWSKYKTLPLQFSLIGADTMYESYKNTVGWRAALEYALSPKATLRGGFLTHPSAAPDWNVTPLLPEAGRFEAIVGGGYKLTHGITVNGALQYIHQSDRRGRIVDYNPNTQTNDPNSGTYKMHAILVGLGFSFAF